MNENSIQNMTLTFLNNVTYVITAVLLIVLAGYLLILYIAYRPVFHLTTKLKHVGGEEFEAIGRALDDRSAKIEEQEMLLMDLLLNNLLYKAPISRSKLMTLGIKELGNYYTVFLLNGYVLTDAEAKKMIAETEAALPVKMFVTDLVGENKSVFTLFLDKEEGEGLKEYLYSRCREFGVPREAFFGGMVVSDIEEIWSCLEFCEKELIKNTSGKDPEADLQRTNSNREMKKVMLREDILAYIDAHYRDTDLTQVHVADHFNISTYTLSRIFRNDVGMGFVVYVNAKRIEYAKELLLTTKYSVHSIALQSGFDNDNNFFKVFKANTGISPSTFRES